MTVLSGRVTLLLITSLLSLSGCGPSATPEGAAEQGAVVGGMSQHDAMAALPAHQRVAFMAGHVIAGIALYRAGAPQEAAPHLLHPVSETHAAERVGIDALGFDPAPFEAVSAALEADRPASEVEPMLKAAESNLSLVRRNAGGEPGEIISYLLDTIDEEYTIGVRDGVISDPGEYQDAYGFAVVALETAQGLPEPVRNNVDRELRTLVTMWPAGGPVGSSQPTPVQTVTTQTGRVRQALAAQR